MQLTARPALVNGIFDPVEAVAAEAMKASCCAQKDMGSSAALLTQVSNTPYNTLTHSFLSGCAFLLALLGKAQTKDPSGS